MSESFSETFFKTPTDWKLGISLPKDEKKDWGLMISRHYLTKNQRDKMSFYGMLKATVLKPFDRKKHSRQSRNHLRIGRVNKSQSDKTKMGLYLKAISRICTQS